MRKGPVCDRVKALASQCIDGAVFPGKRWRSRLWLALWNMLGTIGQWIAVVEMTSEVEAAFHSMNHSDHDPRHAIQAKADIPIRRPIFQELLGMPLDLFFTIVSDDQSFEPSIKLRA